MTDPNGGVCLIRRVVIRNYKSIAACDVELGPLTFLVGPNGSGKSNFLDALRFVSDALRYSLEHAVRDRGGIDGIRRQSSEFPEHIGIRLEFQLPSDARGHYAFRIRATDEGYTVQDEECVVTTGTGAGDQTHSYRVSSGTVVESTLAVAPAAVHDRFYLVNVSGIPAFQFIYNALSKWGFYTLNPDVIREFQTPGQRELLARDGSNLAGVLQALENSAPEMRSRIDEYLSQVVPGVTGTDTIRLGHRETIEFLQRVGDKEDWPFFASEMSDGTLRALGVLAALFQRGTEPDGAPLLVGIEEPETALHPGAAAVLIDAIRDSTSLRQIILTSHSPDLLDNPSIGDSEVVAVLLEEGMTRIGHLDEAGRSVLRDHLFTAGDLLRMNQLRPSPSTDPLDTDVTLFGSEAPA